MCLIGENSLRVIDAIIAIFGNLLQVIGANSNI